MIVYNQFTLTEVVGTEAHPAAVKVPHFIRAVHTETSLGSGLMRHARPALSCHVSSGRGRSTALVPVATPQYARARNIPPHPDTGEAYSYEFIPCADTSGSWVKEDRYNSLFAKMTPVSCDDGTDSQYTIIDYADGVSVNRVFARGGDNCACSTVAATHIKAVAVCNTVIKVEGEATVGFDTNAHDPVYWYCMSEMDDPNYSFSITYSGGHGGGCGTYDVTGTSHGYVYVWIPDDQHRTTHFLFVRQAKQALVVYPAIRVRKD